MLPTHSYVRFCLIFSYLHTAEYRDGYLCEAGADKAHTPTWTRAIRHYVAFNLKGVSYQHAVKPKSDGHSTWTQVVMMSVLNRLRNSCGWRSGAKQVSVDAVIPLFAVPTLTIIATQTVYFTFIIFVLTPIVIYHLHHNFLRFLPRSKFFLMWTITSVMMLMLVFEMCVVPLLEILPEENLVFIGCVVGGMFCGHKTKIRADCITQDAENAELDDGNGEMCITCRRKMPPKAYHCRTCQTCVLGREYHCKWLDCCIGTSNLKWYLGCLLWSAVAFIYGSNLTMTSVCHPFILVGTILLPDDCSDVYQQLDLALCFVSAVYSLVVGVILLAYLKYHLWLICLGTTANERRLAVSHAQYNYGVLSSIAQLISCKC